LAGVLSIYPAIDKTNTTQEKTDLTYNLISDKVQRTMGIWGAFRGWFGSRPRETNSRKTFSKNTEGGAEDG
jgi:hypothetical protein